ncbi:protein kinase domain-containing protein [Streptomyces sp. NBC_00073]|uniref:protein kinase domain-containing protein n=1 Tax=Streptomyces sp. NBC_00073 TaxID=2975640 RepID=UPI0032483717
MRVGDELAGRYRLEQRLGKGGMGEVWRAHDLALGRSVAVKVLLEAATSDEVVARFRREATIGARLQHPGITVVHDVGQQDGRLFIVMELLAGEDLATVLAREGRLAVDVAVDLAAQTAEALAAAHQQSVVHRDLKPSNLFLLSGRRLKICDFGIAYSADATAGWTATGQVIGTWAYMAPEQWRSERVDGRCDLYALGCVLYALLSGAPPFGHADLYALMLRHTGEAPLPLREVGAPVPAELDRLVQALLAKDPADRPESAEAVGKALRGLRGLTDDPEPAAARTPEPEPEPGRAPGSEPGHVPPGLPPDPVPGRAPAARIDVAAAAVLDGVVAGRVVPRDPGTLPGSRPGAEAEAEAGADQEPGPGPEAVSPERTPDPHPVPGGGGVTPEVREVVRGLLLEVEQTLRAWPHGADARVEALAVAADAAARFDAELAGRLLADAEAVAWTGSGGDGGQVARLLTLLAGETAPHAPARALRLLTDAEQALFTVFGSNRQGPLLAVAQELAVVAPEQAARLVGHHFADGSAGSRIRARVDVALAVAEPGRAERDLSRIEDAGRRATATYDMVLALAARDLPAALRLSERIGSAGARLLALCQVARDRTAAGDVTGARRALTLAEEELPRVLEERAAWLREEAAWHAERGLLVEAERLRTRADGLLRGRPETAGDEKAAHALGALEEVREQVARAAGPALDPAGARERVERARGPFGSPVRAVELARIARDCVAAAGTTWLPEAAAEPGTPPPPGVTVLAERAGALRPADPDGRRWRQAVRPDALHSAGSALVWRSGAAVGCVRADVGATRWTAFADEGVLAPLLPEGGRLLVSCVADAATVYVDVRRDGGPGVRVVAREPRDGRVRWWRDLPRAGSLRSAGPVLVHEARGDLTVLRAVTGEVVWQRSLSEATRSLAAVGDCLVLTDGRWLQALHLPSGRRMWSQLRGSEAFDREPGLQPVHVLDGELVRAVDRGTGRELWQFAPGVPAARLLVEGDAVYAAGHRQDQGWDLVFALDARTGALRWQRTVVRREGTVCALELLGLRAGGLYVKAARGGRRGRLGRESGPFVAVLDPATGRQRRQWEQPGLADGDTLLVGDQLVLSRPELAAYALP